LDLVTTYVLDFLKISIPNRASAADTGAELTLIREEYVDSSNIIEGQRVTLYTAVSQPFTAKMAVVNLDTPYHGEHKVFYKASAKSVLLMLF
jgi:hypothetical protein